MKTQTKTKNISTRKIKKRSGSTSRLIALARTTHPHLKLVGYKHTGKLINRHHTSYSALVVILLVVGLFLYASENISRSQQMTDNGTTLVGAIVSGPAPTVGTKIITPKNGLNIVDQETIEVTGTCSKNTFVVIQDNNKLVGSTVCTDAGIFMLQIQLQSGKNVLSALNYDNLNQSGPDTPTVTIYVTKTNIPVEVPAPILPNNPSIIPGVDSGLSDCNDYKAGELSIGGEPRVAIVCLPRLFGPKIQQVLGFIVWGGAPPYAVNIDWGNNSEGELLSMPTQGYRTKTFSYAIPGIYNVVLKLKDKDNKTAIVQAAVQVNGETKTPFAAFTDDILHTSWFKTPVPLYLVAVAITLGFWGGDIFDRRFGFNGYRQKSRKTV